MVRNAFLAFLGLVGLFFILRYPADVVGLLNLFVEAADRMADALRSLVHNLPGKAKG